MILTCTYIISYHFYVPTIPVCPPPVRATNLQILYLHHFILFIISGSEKSKATHYNIRKSMIRPINIQQSFKWISVSGHNNIWWQTIPVIYHSCCKTVLLHIYVLTWGFSNFNPVQVVLYWKNSSTGISIQGHWVFCVSWSCPSSSFYSTMMVSLKISVYQNKHERKRS